MNIDRRTLLAAATLMPFAGSAAHAAEKTEGAHPMRRKDRQLTDEETLEVIQHTHHAVLGTVGADGTPYAVPVTPLYIDGTIYFHTAADQKGLRYKNITANPKVSLCYIGRADIAGDEIPKHFAVNYASAIVSGRVSQVTDEAEIKRFFLAFCEHLVPYATPEEVEDGYKRGRPGIFVWKIAIDSMTGKARNKQGYFNKLRSE